MGSPVKKKDPEEMAREISDVNKALEEVIKKMQARAEVRRRVSESSRLHNLNVLVTAHEGSGKKIINELKAEHQKAKVGFIGSFLGDQGKGKQVVSGEGSKQESSKKLVDDLGKITVLEDQGKGKEVFVSNERQELKKKQSDDDDVKKDVVGNSTTESLDSSFYPKHETTTESVDSSFDPPDHHEVVSESVGSSFDPGHQVSSDIEDD